MICSEKRNAAYCKAETASPRTSVHLRRIILNSSSRHNTCAAFVHILHKSVRTMDACSSSRHVLARRSASPARPKRQSLQCGSGLGSALTKRAATDKLRSYAMWSSARGQSRRELSLDECAKVPRLRLLGPVSSGPASSALIGSSERREGGCNSKSKFAFDQPSGFSHLLPPPHQRTTTPSYHQPPHYRSFNDELRRRFVSSSTSTPCIQSATPSALCAHHLPFSLAIQSILCVSFLFGIHLFTFCTDQVVPTCSTLALFTIRPEQRADETSYYLPRDALHNAIVIDEQNAVQSSFELRLGCSWSECESRFERR